MKARQVNILLSAVVYAALFVNSASTNYGWALVGEVFGWTIIIGSLFAVINNKIKESEQ